MSSTIADVLREATQWLRQFDIAEPRASAEVLLADLIAQPRQTLYIDAHRCLDPLQVDLYTARIHRRLKGEPVQYITGTQEFWSLPFMVNAHVLIPRPETELLVEHGIAMVGDWRRSSSHQTVSILDVGVGSGSVGISLVHSLASSCGVGIDIDIGALQVARENAYRLTVEDRITWLCGDLTTPLKGQMNQFALCVSNLPYVTTTEWEQLPHAIKAYEPRLALWGGADGLDLIRRLVMAVPGLLAPRGGLLIEVGWEQAATVVDLIRQQNCFEASGVHLDFAGIERVVWARKS